MAEMNLVTIIFNPDKFTELKKALNEIGVTGMTVTHVEGCGVQHGQKTSVGYYRGVATDISLLPKTKIEVAYDSKEECWHVYSTQSPNVLGGVLHTIIQKNGEVLAVWSDD